MSKKWQLSSSSIITHKKLAVFGRVKQSECRAVKGSTEFNCIIVRRSRQQPVIKMTTSSIEYLLNIITNYTDQLASINQDSPHRCQVITVRICLKWNQPQTSAYNLQSSGREKKMLLHNFVFVITQWVDRSLHFSSFICVFTIKGGKVYRYTVQTILNQELLIFHSGRSKMYRNTKYFLSFHLRSLEAILH